MSVVISKRQASNELAPSREAVLKVRVHAVKLDVNINCIQFHRRLLNIAAIMHASAVLLKFGEIF